MPTKDQTKTAEIKSAEEILKDFISDSYFNIREQDLKDLVLKAIEAYHAQFKEVTASKEGVSDEDIMEQAKWNYETVPNNSERISDYFWGGKYVRDKLLPSVVANTEGEATDIEKLRENFDYNKDFGNFNAIDSNYYDLEKVWNFFKPYLSPSNQSDEIKELKKTKLLFKSISKLNHELIADNEKHQSEISELKQQLQDKQKPDGYIFEGRFYTSIEDLGDKTMHEQNQPKPVYFREDKQKEGGWISVEERLPTLGERLKTFSDDVLTCNSRGEIFVYFYNVSQRTWGKGHIITHWQPLPKAPTTK